MRPPLNAPAATQAEVEDALTRGLSLRCRRIGKLQLANRTFHQFADFRSAGFADRADFADAAFHGATYFVGARFRSQVKFDQAKFYASVGFVSRPGWACLVRDDVQDLVEGDWPGAGPAELAALHLTPGQLM